MKRLILVTIVFGLILIASLIFARTREAKSDGDLLGALGFNTCNGFPCFMGIVPGKTNLTAAVDIISRLGSVTESRECYKQVVRDVVTVQIITIIPQEVPGSPARTKCYPAEKIVGVKIFPETKVSVGTIIAKYGPPCVVTFWKSRIIGSRIAGGSVSLLYPGGMIFNADLSKSNVRGIFPNLPVPEVLHYVVSIANGNEPSDACNQPIREDSFLLIRPWLGFASLEHYEQFKSADSTQ